jgi:hypothetical protein
VLAYVTLITLFQITTSLVALSLDINSIIYYNKVDFRISADEWNKERVFYTFSAGPLLSLAWAIISYRVYKFVKKRGGNIRLFFFWLYLHGCNLFFGCYVTGVITSTGFHWVTNYIPVNRKGEYVISFFFVMVMFVIGFLSTKGFIQMSPAKSLIERFSRRGFILAVCVAPWIVGSALIIIFKIPNILPSEMLFLLMMFTIAVPVLLVQRNFMEVNLVRRSKALGVDFVFLTIAILAVLVYRSLFEFGLEFAK